MAAVPTYAAVQHITCQPASASTSASGEPQHPTSPSTSSDMTNRDDGPDLTYLGRRFPAGWIFSTAPTSQPPFDIDICSHHRHRPYRRRLPHMDNMSNLETQTIEHSERLPRHAVRSPPTREANTMHINTRARHLILRS